MPIYFPLGPIEPEIADYEFPARLLCHMVRLVRVRTLGIGKLLNIGI